MAEEQKYLTVFSQEIDPYKTSRLKYTGYPEPYIQAGVYTGVITAMWTNDRSDLLGQDPLIDAYLNGMFDLATVNLLEIHPYWIVIKYQRAYQNCEKFALLLPDALKRMQDRLEEIFGSFEWTTFDFTINQEIKTMGMPEANMGYRMADNDIPTNHAHYLDGF